MLAEKNQIFKNHFFTSFIVPILTETHLLISRSHIDMTLNSNETEQQRDLRITVVMGEPEYYCAPDKKKQLIYLLNLICVFLCCFVKCMHENCLTKITI